MSQTICKYIYIFFIGKTMKHNLFLQCCLHFAILLWHPRQKTQKTTLCLNATNHRLRSLQKAKRIYQGPKIGATNLEAGLLNFSIVAPFLGPESGPCFGATKHKQELFNTGSKCATAAASWQQHISVILQGYIACPRSLLYYLFEAPVLGPWAHLGFQKKRPQCLNKQPTKTWGMNRNGLGVKLLRIMRKTTQARVANHNGLDAKLLRGSWTTTKARVANHNGSDAKLLRMSLKNEEKKKILFLLSFGALS